LTSALLWLGAGVMCDVDRRTARTQHSAHELRKILRAAAVRIV